MTPTNKQPLFIVSGASGVGKSTLCEQLFQKEKDYIVLESDLLWDERFNTPQNNYCEYRRLWMRMCANIAQIGLPVVLCGCAVPEQFESQPERALFTQIHYLAAVCNEEVLLHRMRDGRKIEDEAWLKSSMDFNRWLKTNGEGTQPGMTLLDTTHLTPQQAAEQADRWIHDRLENGKHRFFIFSS